MIIEQKIILNCSNTKQGKDKGCMIRLLRVNPNGEYGRSEYQGVITEEQRRSIEKILGISEYNDYRRII